MSSKISNLPVVTTPAPADLLPLVQAGNNYKISLNQLRKMLGLPLRFGQIVKQEGTDAPTVISTLTNTMGTTVSVAWSRTENGKYTADFSGITFPDPDKILVVAFAQKSPTGIPVDVLPVIIQYYIETTNKITLIVVDPLMYAGVDDSLSHYIEFQYYDL